ncbi:MAG: hypothetical protein LBM39_00310 [Candidatus Methanoplasma sp.]|jgi:hypothetical protein|nr:hypothetical protein [Candidatus Methanoplasma sp.]
MLNLKVAGRIGVFAVILFLLGAAFVFIPLSDETNGVIPTSYDNSDLTPFTGTGTELDPYKITNAGNLKKFAHDVNHGIILTKGKYFSLTADINLSTLSDYDSYGWIPVGDYWNSSFKGIFDGNGHKITNLWVGSGFAYAGLFGTIGENAIVKNLGVEVALGKSVVATGSGQSVHAGVLAGESSRSIVQNCYAIGNVSAMVTSSHWNSDAGGLIGVSVSGSTTDSYAKGNATATNSSGAAYAGGLVGSSYGTIERCYATGQAIANAKESYSGGLTGYGSGKDSYYLESYSGAYTSSGGKSISSSQLYDRDTFSSWNIDSTSSSWIMQSSGPSLKVFGGSGSGLPAYPSVPVNPTNPDNLGSGGDSTIIIVAVAVVVVLAIAGVVLFLRSKIHLK